MMMYFMHTVGDAYDRLLLIVVITYALMSIWFMFLQGLIGVKLLTII